LPADVAGSRPGNSWQMRLLSRTCDTFKNNKCSPKRGSKFKTPAGLTLPVDRGQSRGTLCVVEVSELWSRLLGSILRSRRETTALRIQNARYWTKVKMYKKGNEGDEVFAQRGLRDHSHEALLLAIPH
jgi:hypothetical protein